MRTWIFLLVFVAGLVFARAADPVVLRFAVNPTESSVSLRKDYEPLRAALESALGLKVELFFAPDYTSVIEAMRFRQIELCHLGNNSAIEVVDRANGEVLVQTIDVDGHPGYWPIIVTHRESTIDSLEQLVANASRLAFAMGDPQSTSGTLVPGHYAFAPHGLNPVRDFKALRSSNHEANLLSVAMRRVDAATANTEAFDRLRSAQPKLAAQLKVIWKGPLIASDPLMMRRDLDPDLKARLLAFFTAFGRTAKERAVIAPLKWSGFRASGNEQLLPYRLLRLSREQAALEADERLTPEEKRRRLAELAGRRAALESSEATP